MEMLTPRIMTDQKTLMRDMMAHAVHFGHKSEKWNPKMAQYIYTKKNGVHIFDLNKTFEGLMSATEFLQNAARQGKTILFVSTKQQASNLIQQEAEKCKMPYVKSRWIPGLLTNFKTLRSRVKYLQDLIEKEESGEFEKYTKKEIQGFKKEIGKLKEALGGVVTLEKKPDVVFVLDVNRDRIAVKEAKIIGATVVAVVDSNSDPEDVDYIIPANDDAIKSISFLFSKISDSILEGQKSRT